MKKITIYLLLVVCTMAVVIRWNSCHKWEDADLYQKMSRTVYPPFSISRFTGNLAEMASYAMPPEHLWDINMQFLISLIPFAIAYGAWTIGNIGHKKCNFKWALVGAYTAYPLRHFIFNESYWFMGIVLASALLFDSFGKAWNRKAKKHHIAKRVVVIGFYTCLYLLLWIGSLYFNGTNIDCQGYPVPVYKTMHHFFANPWWFNLQWLYNIYTSFVRRVEGWIQFKDTHAEQNAYKVLGVGPDSSLEEITTTWRRLSRLHHPDKVKEESLRLSAQILFMDIQDAYKVLFNSKSQDDFVLPDDHRAITQKDIYLLDDYVRLTLLAINVVLVSLFPVVCAYVVYKVLYMKREAEVQRQHTEQRCCAFGIREIVRKRMRSHRRRDRRVLYDIIQRTKRAFVMERNNQLH